MNERLNALSKRVNDLRQKETQLHQENLQKLTKMLLDIKDLSRYMQETFGTSAVPMPFSINEEPFCINSLINPETLCSSSDMSFCFTIQEWNPEEQKPMKFFGTKHRCISYCATQTFPLDLLEDGFAPRREHKETVEKALKKLYLHWEDTYKKETEALVAELVEKYLEKYEDRPQGLSL